MKNLPKIIKAVHIASQSYPLKDKVQEIVDIFGYITSYAGNMLYAINESEVDKNYCIDNNYVIKLNRDLTWSLEYLLGEYILNSQNEKI